MTDDVYALMTQSQELPYGEARTILVEDALRRAEAAGDDVLAFRVRTRLTDAYQYGGEPAKALATFSRALAEHDRDPARFDETHLLMWQMKAVVSALTLFPEIPLDRAHALLDDMERRYLAGGHSLQAVYRRRHIVAQHIGDGTADEWYLKWRAARRDELSDCEGCDPTGMVRHLARVGRHEDAFEIAEPVLRSELSCNEQPQAVLTAMLPVYLRTDRAEQAADAHRRAYRVHRARLADLGDIAEHLEFCAATGNEARGLEIVERHLGWLDRAPSPHAAMEFAVAAALILDRVTAAGHAAATVRRPAADGRAAADVPLPELREELAGRATELAARFDARNGTSCQGDKMRATLEAEQVVGFLPLAAHHRRPAPAPASQPVPQDDVTAEEDLDTLLDIADKRHTNRDMERAMAAWRRFDVVAETTEPNPLQMARRLDGKGVERAVDGDQEGAVTCWEEASRLFGELGEETRRHRALGRLGAMHAKIGDPRGVEEMTAAVEHFAEHPTAQGDATSSLLRLATAHIDLDHPAEALTVLDRVAPDDSPDRAGQMWFLRGQALLMTGDNDDAVTVLRRSTEAARASGDPEDVAAPALLLAQTLARRDSGPDEETLALLDEGIAALPGRPSPTRAAAYTDRGLALLVLDRPADAVADLAEAIAGWTAEGLHVHAVRLRVDLAAGYLAIGRHLEAAEVAEEALPGLAGLGNDAEERRCRLILARAQKGMGEEDAAATFADLAEDAAKDGADDAVAHFLNESADVLTGLDMDAVAAERFAEAAEAYEKAGDPYGVVRARRRAAMCLMWSGEGDAAVPAMETARASLASLPPDNEPARIWETALVSYDQARLLAQVGNLPEAASHASAAVDGFSTLDETDPAEEAARLRDDIRSAMEE